LHLIVSFPSFDFNIIVDVRCGVSVLLWALVLHCFPGCSRAGAAQRLCRPEFLSLRFCPPSNAIMRPSFSFSLS
jgi:hypothetical protein